MNGVWRLSINKPGLVMPRRLLLGPGITLAAGAALGGQALSPTSPLLLSARSDSDGRHYYHRNGENKK